MRVIGLVLAAGIGSRFGSSLPKVFQPMLGRKMVEYPLAALSEAGVTESFVVTQKKFASEVPSLHKNLLFQKRASGTGDAVLTARRVTGKERAILVVVNGDSPLFTGDTIRRFLNDHIQKGAFCSFAACEVDDPRGYGRVCLKRGSFAGIIEERNLKPSQRRILLINAGLYAFEAPEVFEWLESIPIRKDKGERYLTDIFNVAYSRGRRVNVFTDFNRLEGIGVNTPSHYALAVRVLRDRICERHMANGVFLEDPGTTWIDDTVEIAAGARIRPFVVLEGPAVIKTGCVVGPFAHIRPHTILESGVHIGNFVEVKNSRLGEGVHAAHLSYIGDAEVGDRTNIGAGTITCNFDGVRKHKTIIGQEAFIGSDTILVAPVRVGDRAMTGAGSVISRDIPDDALGLERSPLTTIPDYKKYARKKPR